MTTKPTFFSINFRWIFVTWIFSSLVEHERQLGGSTTGVYEWCCVWLVVSVRV